MIPEVVLAERLLLGVERAVVAADAVQRLGRRLGHRVGSTLPVMFRIDVVWEDFNAS